MSSARAALQLKDRGFRNAKPLRGGISGWRKMGYPLLPTRRRSKPAPVGVEVQGESQ